MRRNWERMAVPRAKPELVDALVNKADNWLELYQKQESKDPTCRDGVVLKNSDYERLDLDWLSSNNLVVDYSQGVIPQGFWLRWRP